MKNTCIIVLKLKKCIWCQGRDVLEPKKCTQGRPILLLLLNAPKYSTDAAIRRNMKTIQNTAAAESYVKGCMKSQVGEDLRFLVKRENTL